MTFSQFASRSCTRLGRTTPNVLYSLLLVLTMLTMLLWLLQDHLSVYSLMDISLDTFPYSGGCGWWQQQHNHLC